MHFENCYSSNHYWVTHSISMTPAVPQLHLTFGIKIHLKCLTRTLDAYNLRFFSFPPPIRTPEPEEADVEFDASLLEDTENMAANEILWNNLTAENLQAL